MPYIVVLIFTVLVVLAYLREPVGPIGIWVFALITHGIFVHFFGSELSNLPTYVGLLVVGVTLFSMKTIHIPSHLGIRLLLFIIAMVMSVLVNGSDMISIEKVLTYIKPMLLSAIVAGSVRKTSDLRALTFYIVLATVLGSVFNIYQKITGGYVVVNEWDSSLNRASGLRVDPNDTAMLLLFSIPLIYYRFMASRSMSGKYLNMLAALVVIVGLILTGSRSGLVVFVFLAISLAFSQNSEGSSIGAGVSILKKALVFIVIFSTAILFAPDYYLERVSTVLSGSEVGGSESMYVRAFLVMEGVVAWYGNPIFGVGPGLFHSIVSDASSILTASPSGHVVAHNMYLELLVEMGSLGLLAFMLIAVGALKSFFALGRGASGLPSDASLGRCYCLGLLSLLLMGLTLSQGYNSVLWFVIGLAYGVKSIGVRRSVKCSRVS